MYSWIFLICLFICLTSQIIALIILLENYKKEFDKND